VVLAVLVETYAPSARSVVPSRRHHRVCNGSAGRQAEGLARRADTFLGDPVGP